MKAAGLVKGIAKYAIGFGLLAFVIWRSWDDKVLPNGNVQPGLKTILQQAPDWSYIAAAAVLMVIVLGCQFMRWYLLVRAVGLPFTLRDALRLGFVGYFYNIFLPGAIGGDGLKAIFIARDNPTRMPVAVATVVVDRLLGLFGLVLLTTVVGGTVWLQGDPTVLNNDYLKTIIRTMSIATGVILAAWVIMGLLSEHRKNRFEERLHKLKPRKLGQTLAEFWFAARTYRARARTMFIAVMLSAVAHICMVLLMFVCVRVFPLLDPATLVQTAIIAPPGYIAQVFFPAPGGVGGAEAIFGFLYTLLNRPETTGAMGRLTLRLFEWSAGLLGYLMYLNMKKELKVEPESQTVQTVQ